MRAGSRADESGSGRESGKAGSNGLHSVNGTRNGNGSIAQAEDSGNGTGGTGRGNDGRVTQEAWFAPVEDDVISDCPGGVCPVPWATKEEPPVIQEDLVNHPSHYTDGGIECIEAIEAQLTVEEYRGYLRGNCTKYLWRCMLKGKPVEDLKKCQWYLERLIQTFED
jgi:hypothetical protein